jgi:hypothetical protein
LALQDSGPGAEEGLKPRATIPPSPGGPLRPLLLTTLRGPVNRFFKSAAFPIIVVIVLAYLVNDLLIKGSSSQGGQHTWTSMLKDVDSCSKPGAQCDIKALKHRIGENALTVTTTDNKTYTIGIPGDDAWKQVYNDVSTLTSIDVSGYKK